MRNVFTVRDFTITEYGWCAFISDLPRFHLADGIYLENIGPFDYNGPIIDIEGDVKYWLFSGPKGAQIEVFND